jgi:hypothetical protein
VGLPEGRLKGIGRTVFHFSARIFNHEGGSAVNFGIAIEELRPFWLDEWRTILGSEAES